MRETKEKIEKFVNDIIKKNDIVFLDVLWIFSYSIPSQSGYHNNKGDFKKWFGKICIRHLQKKYNLRQEEIKEKMKIFVDFLNNIPDFLSKESFYEDDKLLRNMLINKTSEILIRNIRSKIPNLSDLDRKILSFVLHYIPIRIQDSIKKAEDRRKEYPDCKDKYGFLSDFYVRVDKETGSIAYFEIDTKEWTHLFNLLFDEELKEQRFKVKSYRRGAGLIIFPQEQHEEYSFWQFGDELVKVGIGYWTFSISAKGNVRIEFIIPNFIYEAIKDYKDKLPKIENFEEKINEIKKEKEWSLDDFEETEAVSEVLESEIEASMISNPEILEEGVELVGNQYPTSVGYIDILCRDKNGNFVVVELKRGAGSYKAVGQIQKYMVWVSENLAKDRQVRGIIVVKEHDQELEYTVKGSKFPIEIKIFGQEPPTGENIKYCSRCGKPNPKSAKYCIKCGQEFWM
ncbi:Endonuclease NucS [Candidatus Methanoperedenaceae archaeon GB50]|nr:Endonuclease NucS [Candidatus Methanoperedenaceae archaeon GB50]CAD7779223.1 MAG: Endonuclease NucS [Candidatus Methanoperedenaceae archaeon GB50]